MRILISIFIVIHLFGCDVVADDNCLDDCEIKSQKNYNSHLKNKFRNEKNISNYDSKDFDKIFNMYGDIFKVEKNIKSKESSFDFNLDDLDHLDNLDGFINSAEIFFYEKK